MENKWISIFQLSLLEVFSKPLYFGQKRIHFRCGNKPLPCVFLILKLMPIQSCLNENSVRPNILFIIVWTVVEIGKVTVDIL